MIENDKSNWRNAFYSCIAVLIGSFFILASQNPIGNSYPFLTWILIQPFAWLILFSLPIILELISRIQKRGKNDSGIKRS